MCGLQFVAVHAAVADDDVDAKIDEEHQRQTEDAEPRAADASPGMPRVQVHVDRVEDPQR